jgi:xanthine dehydrogenase accessory factor
MLTIAHSAEHTEVKSQWLPENDIPLDMAFPDTDNIRDCLVHERLQLFTKSSDDPKVLTEVLVEPVIPKPLLIIAGGGHVGQALALQAGLVGFDITVVDDRPEFTDPALFPQGTTTYDGDIPKIIAAQPIAGDAYIVIVTRGHKLDAESLEACIHTPAAYVGMIGSKRKVALIRKNFIESGIATEEEFDRVHAPIGLDIGAVTVPEIAASITAQLISVRRKSGPDLSTSETVQQ